MRLASHADHRSRACQLDADRCGNSASGAFIDQQKGLTPLGEGDQRTGVGDDGINSSHQSDEPRGRLVNKPATEPAMKPIINLLCGGRKLWLPRIDRDWTMAECLGFETP